MVVRDVLRRQPGIGTAELARAMAEGSPDIGVRKRGHVAQYVAMTIEAARRAGGQ